MKRQLAFIFAVLICFTAFPKSINTVPQSNIDSLIDQSKYASAWSALNKLHDDSSTHTLISKSEFCLKYFSHTSYHLKFYFADLEQGETLLNRRQKEISTSELFANFNVEHLLLKELRKDEGNSALHFVLGRFYYDVFLTYHDQWKKGTKETMSLYYYHFMEAHKQNKTSALSCYAISYFYQSRRTNLKAEQFLLEALMIDSNYAAAHYNLAYSYSIQDSTELAIVHSQKAYKNYKMKSFKADAASMTGILYGDLNKHEHAINWLLIADAMSPGTVVVYESLLKSYLALKKEDEALLITKNLYSYDWRTGRIFNSILDSYMNEKQTPKLQLFLENEIISEPVNKEYQGFTYMHLTQMQINLNLKDQAMENLLKARSSFDICYDKDHAIYRVLEKLEWSIKQI